MKKFKFKFESVEKLRKSKEDEALRGLGQAQARYQAELGRKAAFKRELEAALIRREGLGSTPVPTSAFAIEDNFIIGTKQRIVQQDQAIHRAARGVEKAMRIYLHARKQKKMMEKLRETAFAEYRKEYSKYEQKQNEELYVMRSSITATMKEEESA